MFELFSRGVINWVVNKLPDLQLGISSKTVQYFREVNFGMGIMVNMAIF